MDDRIRNFLGRLPTGSKVLLTSRIGLGELEYRVKLEAMDKQESVQLLRAIARARGVDDITRASNEQLAKYCNKMQDNPGFIKWFVSAIQVGRRPEEVLAKRGVFLDFCMSNVYDYLSEGGKQVIRSMLCVPGQHNQAELAFLNKMEVGDLQRSLYELQRTNMALMTSAPIGSTFETKYELSELARDYIYQHHPVESEEYKTFQKRNRQLNALSEQIYASQGEGRFYYRHLTTRSKSDAVAAKYLLDAHKHILRKELSEADQLVSKARDLAPGYFEVRRITAYLRAVQGNPVVAKQEFEAAVDLNPNDAALRYHFGEFLIRNLEDTEAALHQFAEGSNIDPVSLELQLGLARSNLYLKNFTEALRIIEALLKRPVIIEFGNKAVYDLYLQVFHRQAEQYLGMRLPLKALDELDKFKEAYEACPENLLDARMKDQVRKAMHTARICADQLQDNSMQETARYMIDWISFQTDPRAPNKFNNL